MRDRVKHLLLDPSSRTLSPAETEKLEEHPDIRGMPSPGKDDKMDVKWNKWIYVGMG